jgi:hypothetical protein
LKNALGLMRILSIDLAPVRSMATSDVVERSV